MVGLYGLKKTEIAENSIIVSPLIQILLNIEFIPSFSFSESTSENISV